jgi:hypothetical protein
MSTLTRQTAAQLVLEHGYRFQTQLMYVDWTDGTPTVYHETIAQLFRNPKTGRPELPVTLCVLVPNPIQAGPIVTNRTNQLMPSNHPEPFDWAMPVHASWRVAPNVFNDEDTLMDLVDIYGITTAQVDGGWIAHIDEGDSISAETRADAIVLCVLRAEGLEVTAFES